MQQRVADYPYVVHKLDSSGREIGGPEDVTLQDPAFVGDDYPGPSGAWEQVRLVTIPGDDREHLYVQEK